MVRTIWRQWVLMGLAMGLLLWTSCHPLRKMGGEEAAIFQKAKVKQQSVYGKGENEEMKPLASNLVSMSAYDTEGRIIEHRRLSPVTSDTFYTTYLYDTEGKVSSIIYSFAEETTPVVYVYDKKNVLRQTLEAGAEARDNSYHYNDKGQCILELGKAAYPNDDDGVNWVVQDSTVYDYYPSGKMSRKRYYMFGEMYNDTHFFYNKYQLLIREEEYRDDGTIARRTHYTHNKKGLPILIRKENLSEEWEEYQLLIYEYYAE